MYPTLSSFVSMPLKRGTSDIGSFDTTFSKCVFRSMTQLKHAFSNCLGERWATLWLSTVTQITRAMYYKIDAGPKQVSDSAQLSPIRAVHGLPPVHNHVYQCPPRTH
jgi:hypothetical protein